MITSDIWSKFNFVSYFLKWLFHWHLLMLHLFCNTRLNWKNWLLICVKTGFIGGTALKIQNVRIALNRGCSWRVASILPGANCRCHYNLDHEERKHNFLKTQRDTAMLRYWLKIWSLKSCKKTCLFHILLLRKDFKKHIK